MYLIKKHLLRQNLKFGAPKMREKVAKWRQKPLGFILRREDEHAKYCQLGFSIGLEVSVVSVLILVSVSARLFTTRFRENETTFLPLFTFFYHFFTTFFRPSMQLWITYHRQCFLQAYFKSNDIAAIGYYIRIELFVCHTKNSVFVIEK